MSLKQFGVAKKDEITSSLEGALYEVINLKPNCSIRSTEFCCCVYDFQLEIQDIPICRSTQTPLFDFHLFFEPQMFENIVGKNVIYIYMYLHKRFLNTHMSIYDIKVIFSV